MLAGIFLGDFALIVGGQNYEFSPNDAENVGAAVDVGVNAGCGVLIVRV